MRNIEIISIYTFFFYLGRIIFGISKNIFHQCTFWVRIVQNDVIMPQAYHSVLQYLPYMYQTLNSGHLQEGMIETKVCLKKRFVIRSFFLRIESENTPSP